VHRMTGLAGCQFLSGKVRFVALHAGRNQPMPVMMAEAAFLDGMGTGKLLELPGRTGMTVAAVGGESGHQRNLPRGMRIDVAAEAFRKLVSMNQVMALAAFRHQFGPVVLLRIIGVKALVTSLALNLVPQPVFLQQFKMAAVALTALGNGKGFRGLLIQFGFVRNLAGFYGKGVCHPTKGDQQQHTCNKFQIIF